jgi:hypothetical protein
MSRAKGHPGGLSVLLSICGFGNTRLSIDEGCNKAGAKPVVYVDYGDVWGATIEHAE